MTTQAAALLTRRELLAYTYDLLPLTATSPNGIVTTEEADAVLRVIAEQYGEDMATMVAGFVFSAHVLVQSQTEDFTG